MYILLPTYSNTTEKWTSTTFDTRDEFIKFVESQYKEPGQYGLVDTEDWRIPAFTFDSIGAYTKEVTRTTKWAKYWDFEKEKILNGVIINGFYVPEDYYWYLNFTRIDNMQEGKETFPEMFDSDYHYFLYLKLCELYGLFDVTIKKRRWGLSLKNAARITRLFVHKKSSLCKIVGYSEDHVSATWDIVKFNLNFINEHTGWYRNLMGQGYEIENKREVRIGNKKLYKGKLSKIKGVITKQSPTKGVGGKGSTLNFIEEAGVNPTVDKTFAYIVPTVKIGGKVTAQLSIAGSVGELKEAEAIKKLFLNPVQYGFLSVEKEWPGTTRSLTTGFFVPTYWNYLSVEVDESGKAISDTIRYYDKDGNSDIDGALKDIFKKREVAKLKSHEDYQREISQNPINPEEPFNAKEENVFPVHLIAPQLVKAEQLRNNFYPVELFRDEKNKIRHKIVPNTKVKDFPVKKSTDRRGCVIVYEFPMANAPVNLYFAGIDPVSSKNVAIENTKSLMSCYIIKGEHNINGEISKKQLVAEYTGRHDNPETTFEIITMLWEWYNARPLIENNKESYIQWLISNKKQYTLIKTNELSNLREINFNYSSLYPYGVNVDKSNKTKDYLIDLIIDSLKEEKVKYFNDETGEVTVKLGISDVWDPELLKELLNYSPKQNHDRLFSFGLALWAVKIFNEMNHIKVTKLDAPKDPYRKQNLRRKLFSDNQSRRLFNKIK
jgi:hypothetical protein